MIIFKTKIKDKEDCRSFLELEKAIKKGESFKASILHTKLIDKGYKVQFIYKECQGE